MKLAPSSYDCKPIADPAELLCSDALLRDHIERIQREFAGYGYRRLGKQLRREGDLGQRQTDSPYPAQIPAISHPLAEF